eukprot:TRINITY_DN56683_c0_g1_i1.p1 TRINITY_DN56683_c0_g1~~TRINITY_DN56683_c0_g1_i1.p1  ORF type:complete len:294 (+),score=41.70 TRINITY_DN56683_c0_g1_i1:571-1452(+)
MLYYIATYRGGDLRNCRVPSSLFPRKGCAPPAHAVVQGLNMLAAEHNVVIRPHPLDADNGDARRYLETVFPRCVVDDYKLGNSPQALAERAEVLISEPSALLSTLLPGLPRKPIVYVLRHWGLYLCARDSVLNDSMVEVFFPDHVNSSSAFLYAVARARAFVGPAQERARQEYVRLYHGDVDGYEEYRVALMLLRYYTLGNRHMAREVERLTQILAKFTTVPGDEEFPSSALAIDSWLGAHTHGSKRPPGWECSGAYRRGATALEAPQSSPWNLFGRAFGASAGVAVGGSHAG